MVVYFARRLLKQQTFKHPVSCHFGLHTSGPVNTHIKASINGLPWKSRPYRAIPVMSQKKVFDLSSVPRTGSGFW